MITTVTSSPTNAITGSSSTLLSCFMRLLLELTPVFSQGRTFHRAERLMLSGLIALGRRWISRWICVTDRAQRDWSADYRLFSRSPWAENDLFDPVLRRTLEMGDDQYVVIALDETTLSRAGRRVAAAKWLRDPLSPKFRYNLKRGVMYLHGAVLPRSKDGEARIRAFPIRLQMREIAKKPKNTKKHPATKEELKAYREEAKRLSLSIKAVAMIHELRAAYDNLGAKNKILVFVVDGSFCNRTVLSALPERTIVVARARKDAVLCRKATSGSRRQIYDPVTFTPQAVYHDESIPWTTGTFFYGGAARELRYKELQDLRWRGGTKRIPVRLIVLHSTPYQLTQNGKTQYRDPAYVLTTDHTAPVEFLIQSYLDRWQIEVTHRELKNTLGLGQAQVWSDLAVPRQPAFVAAGYSLLLLAAHSAYGPSRTNVYEPLPKWRRRASRPSALDLITQLRKEVEANPHAVSGLDAKTSYDVSIRSAAG